MRIREKAAWAIAGSLGLFVAAAMSGVVSGGPLDPPEPVGSTMKTLEEIPGSWSRQLSGPDSNDDCGSQRFDCVLGGLAVLDRETGLVWQQEQELFGLMSWPEAGIYCRELTIGNRRGFRLPTIHELQTLLDTGGPGNVSPNHPFDRHPKDERYWTSSPGFADTEVFVFQFEPPTISSDSAGPFADGHAWCVRAPGGAAVAP